MPRRRLRTLLSPERQLRAFLRPRARRLKNWLGLLGLLAAAMLVAALAVSSGLKVADWLGEGPLRRAPAPSGGGYLLCTWNVENLFDDRDDPAFHDEMEDFFGRNPRMLGRKLDNLAKVLLAMNGGRGPDILAVVEVENRRAVELLMARLNEGLSESDRYAEIVHHDNRSGRPIEPAIITRLPVRASQTRGFGSRRIVEGQVEVEGLPLVVQVSHWTSRRTDETGTKRSEYARECYRGFLARYGRNQAVDMVLCGDFNDTPSDVSVRNHLRAIADISRIKQDPRQPWLWDLTARLEEEGLGTYKFGRRWEVLDHIVASPGLADAKGWAIRPETLEVDPPPFGGRPRRFGGPGEAEPRGASDHLPVTVRLRANIPKPATVPGPIPAVSKT